MIEFRFHDEFKTTSMSKLKNNILERFDELKKEIVIYNANIFNEKNINSYNCIEILINLVYLLNQGEKFTKSEKENLFFSVTKLFYSNDVELRRVIYLFIRHLDFYENSFILTGTLINEINKSEQMLKPNGFRIMGQIVDATSVAPIEKLLKNAISSNVPEICSSAVLCTLYMCLKGFNIAKPWISEITDKLNSSLSQSNLLTFHTLLLLREIKDSDRLFLLKTFANLCSTNLKSQFATCQLIRYIVDFLRRGEVEDNKTYSLFVNFLETCLFKQQQEAIILEAARGLLSLPLKETLLTSTFETLKNLLSNGKRVVKYATLKILDRVCGKYANILSLQFFLELEKIIDDSANNSSIKAVALSIFLKISKGLSDYRLEKMFKTFCEQYTSFKEEFKKEIVCISREISRENTSKNKLYFNFFSSLLKLDASFGTKLEILESIIWYIYNDADLKRPGVLCLAEYIEDCQYDNLKTKILHVLGKEGPTANSPSQLVRYIYNRIILENAAVRAAAISALGEIANKDTSLKKNILNLIKGSLNDSDNEVRERAFFYVKALEEKTNEIEDSQMIKSQGELKKFVFSNKTYDVDLIQNVLKAQKESLLSSKNIAQQLSQTLNDPESLAKILVNIPKPEVKNSETTAKTKSAEKKSTEDGLTGLDEYKKTIFYKAFGKPKLISQIHVSLL
jgi:coatomer protein complex subunit gamma